MHLSKIHLSEFHFGDPMSSLALGTRRFLLVDGNRNMRRLIRAMLVRAGASDIVEAETTDNASEMIFLARPDLVICDRALSPMDGLAFVRLLKKTEKRDNLPLPVILMLSQVDQASVVEARAAGPDHVVAKPFSPETLLKRIQLCLGPLPKLRVPAPVHPTYTSLGDRFRRVPGLEAGFSGS